MTQKHRKVMFKMYGVKEAAWTERGLLAWRLIAQLSLGPTPHRTATMEDKMARGTDLTLQMSFLPGVERTIYVPRFRFC